MNCVPIKIRFMGFLSKLTSDTEVALTVPCGVSLSEVLLSMVDYYGPEVKKMFLDNSSHLYKGLVLSKDGSIIPHERIDTIKICRETVITLRPLAAGG